MGKKSKKKSKRNRGGRGNTNPSMNNNSNSANNARNSASASASTSSFSSRTFVMDDEMISKIVKMSEGSPIPPPPSDVDSIVLDSDEERLLDMLVALIVARDAVPEDFIDNESKLKRKMKEIWFYYHDDFIVDLRVHVINALYDHDFNGTKFDLGGISYPLLIMFCQWKMIRNQIGYLGGDEMVEIALKMGADPNCSLSNKVTPIFLAVKYGSPTTVQLLIDAGCNIRALDCFGRTCLYNTIERCYPPVVKIILDHLPADEIFWNDVDSFNSGQKESYTAVDWILKIYESIGSLDSITGHNSMDLHTSWKIIGKPTIDDICTTIILLRQNGCTFSPNNLCIMGRYFHGIPIIRNSTALAFKDEIKILIQSIVGLYVPSTIKVDLYATKIEEHLKISQSNEDTLNYECPICLESVEDTKRKIGLTLYCGHTFCWACISTYGRLSDDNTHIKCCPMCRKLLCLDVCSRPKLGLKDILMNGNRENPDTSWGTALMTEQQLQVEYLARKLAVPFKNIPKDRQAVLLHFNDIDPQSLSRGTDMLTVDPELFSKDTSSMLDLGSTQNTAYGSREPASVCRCPMLGRVVIPLTLKGIPILAYVSSKSPFTVASKAFVDNFGLRRKNLTSKNFVAINGTTMEDIFGLDEFEFNLGGISLKINTAIESSCDFGFLGLQLGLDFFSLLAYCSFDVQIDESEDGSSKSFIRSSIFRNQFCSADNEEMRLYGRTGEICRVPILHINPDSLETSYDTTISFEENQKFQECNWCCRVFPSDMLSCSKCTGDDQSNYAYYCDKECQEKAFLVHKQHCGKSKKGF